MNMGNDTYYSQISPKNKSLTTIEAPLTDGDGEPAGIVKLSVKGTTFPIKYEGQTGDAKDIMSLEELVNHLRKRVVLTEEEVPRLRTLIIHKMYFNIAYLAKLAERTTHKKITYTEFEDIVSLDDFLRLSLNRLLPSIEKFAKSTLLNYLLSEFDDSEIYLDTNLYKYNSDKDKQRLDQTLSVCAEAIKDAKKSNDAVSHHVMKHGGHIPIWIFFDTLTFGQFNMLVTCFDRKILQGWHAYIKDNSIVEDEIITVSPKSLHSFLNTIQILRNTASHLSRVYGRVFTYNPNIKKDDSYWSIVDIPDSFNKPEKQIHSLFSGLMAARVFYSYMSEEEIEHWNIFVSKLKKRLEGKSHIHVRGYMGFPKNWESLLKIAIDDSAKHES